MNSKLAAALTCTLLLCGCGTEVNSTIGTISTGTGAETTVTTETSVSGTTVALSTLTTETTATEAKTEKKTESAAEAEQTETQAPAETEAPAATEAPATEAPATEAPQQTEAPAQSIWDAAKIGANPADYLSANPGYARTEADSCVGPGKDINYTYSDRIVMCYAEGGPEKIVEIDITAAGIKTRKGVGVGASAAEIEAAYGVPAEAGRYLYSTEDGSLEFLMTDGVVTTIALY